MDKSERMASDHGLDYLLSLDGESMDQERGYWVKFKARQVGKRVQKPHGISYSLTLHDRYNRRVMGFDNAHIAKEKRGKYKTRRRQWDHKHRNTTCKGVEYEFDSAEQLVMDFWSAVDEYLAAHK